MPAGRCRCFLAGFPRRPSALAPSSTSLCRKAPNTNSENCRLRSVERDFAEQFAAVAALVPPSQIVFGTDYPFVPIEATIAGVDAFFADPLRDPVYRANAATLLPRLV